MGNSGASALADPVPIVPVMPGGIEKRDNDWRVRIRRRGQSVSATFSTRHEAEVFRAEWIAAATSGDVLPEPPAPKPIAVPVRAATVEEACRELIEGMVTGVIRTRSGGRYRRSTIRTAENRLRRYVLPRLGAVPITELRRGDVQRFVDELAIDTSPATAANTRDVLRVALRRQLDLEVIDANPASGVRAPAIERAPARFLSAEEAERL